MAIYTENLPDNDTSVCAFSGKRVTASSSVVARINQPALKFRLSFNAHRGITVDQKAGLVAAIIADFNETGGGDSSTLEPYQSSVAAQLLGAQARLKMIDAEVSQIRTTQPDATATEAKYFNARISGLLEERARIELFLAVTATDEGESSADESPNNSDEDAPAVGGLYVTNPIEGWTQEWLDATFDRPTILDIARNDFQVAGVNSSTSKAIAIDMLLEAIAGGAQPIVTDESSADESPNNSDGDGEDS